MTDNEVAVESNIRVEVAESLLEGIKSLASEHNLQLDEEEVEIVSGLEEKLEQSTNEYNEIFEQLIEARKEKDSLERELAFKEVVEELTDTQAEKLRVLSEGVSYETVEEFSQKLTIIRDQFVSESVQPASEEEQSDDLLQEETETIAYADPSVAAYVQSIDRFAAKT